MAGFPVSSRAVNEPSRSFTVQEEGPTKVFSLFVVEKIY